MNTETAAPATWTPVVLVIDDDPLVSVVVRRALDGVTHRLFTAPDSATGLSEIEAKKPDLVLLDNVLPDGLGLDALTKVRALAPQVPVLFITGRGSGGAAIEAMKLSAFDYITKPLDPSKLRVQIDRALQLRRMLKREDHVEALTSNVLPASPDLVEPDGLVGECPAMQNVFKAIGKATTQDIAVLIRGEHGTGKESVAREIHRHGARARGPMVQLHCSGLEEGRLEEELFGHRAGATGTAALPGRIAEADEGTLVLQEIGRVPLPLQSRLLRAIRDRTYEAVDGSVQAIGCRFLAITTEDLEAKARGGEFRSDLFYTLSSFVITLPPVRQRHGDLRLLIDHCLEKLQPVAQAFGVDRPRVSNEAMRVLSAHVWPGNLDELESVLKRGLIEQTGNLLMPNELLSASSAASAVPTKDPEASARFSTDWSSFVDIRVEAGGDTLYAEAVAEMEKKLLFRVLRHTRGNQAQAARLLGITRASLRKKLRLYGIAPRATEG